VRRERLNEAIEGHGCHGHGRTSAADAGCIKVSGSTARRFTPALDSRTVAEFRRPAQVNTSTQSPHGRDMNNQLNRVFDNGRGTTLVLLRRHADRLAVTYRCNDASLCPPILKLDAGTDKQPDKTAYDDKACPSGT